MTFHIITLFPSAFDSYLNESIIKRALSGKKIKIMFYDPKDFESDAKKRIDDKPYGGGPGMVMRALPVVKAIAKARGRKKKAKIVFLTPSGKQFTNEYAKKISENFKDIIIISGRYEGIDERVRKIFKTEEISVGPFILTGGELAAMIMIDVISRFIPGVLGNTNSLEEKRMASSEVYTRPEVLTYKGKKYRVPKVLLSGNHKKIEDWRKNKNKNKRGI